MKLTEQLTHATHEVREHGYIDNTET